MSRRPTPYPGPRSFQRGETLYGRERETAELLDLLIAERIVLLYSPSGAGKSSLLQAALIPELEREGFHVFPTMRVSIPAATSGPLPANRFVASLVQSLQETLPAGQRLPAAEWATLSLAQVLDHYPTAGDTTWHGDVLVFDQFEEILTLDPADSAAKHAFFEQLGEALRDRNRWALVAMREEFVGRLAPYQRPIPTRFSTRYRLELLGPEAARSAIQRPAAAAGVDFTDAAAAKLVDDLRTVQILQPDGAVQPVLGDHVEPVHLQIVCQQLWDRLPEDRASIEPQDVQAYGDVNQALMGFYDTALGRAGQHTGLSERSLRTWVATELITSAQTRALVYRGAELTGSLPTAAADTLYEAYILRSVVRGGDTWYELAHDRLVEPIRESNRRWQAAYHNPLATPTQAWLAAERAPRLLLRGEPLKEARQFARTHPDEATDDETAYLAESIRQARQATRRRGAIIGATAAMMTVLGLFAFFAWQQAQTASSNALAAASMTTLQVDPERSVLLATEAMDIRATHQAEEALHQAVSAIRTELVLAGHAAEVDDVAYSPDGLRVATAGVEPVIRVWDAHTGVEQMRLTGHTATVTGIAFSPDGARLASSSQDGTARVWDAVSGELLLTLTGHTGPVHDVEFSPDGALLATAGQDQTGKVWDAATGELVATLGGATGGHTAEVYAVAFSPDGSQVATGSLDHTAIVWELATGAPIGPALQHGDAVEDVAFSPDGMTLATASWDNTAILWDAASFQPIHTFDTHSGWVRGVAFSPDGATLATSSWDRTAKIWDTFTGREIMTLAGHTGWVKGLAFSPECTTLPGAFIARCGVTLATASEDGTARIWNVARSRELMTFDNPHDLTAVQGVAISPDGLRVATAGLDGLARVWDAKTGQLQLTLRSACTIEDSGYSPDACGLRDVAFSPDGTQLATAGNDRTAVIWDAATGQSLVRIAGHDGVVTSVTFSPDGTQVATSGSDRTARLWDSASGAEMRRLDGHTGRVNSVDFSPDGKRIVTSSADQTARVWDIATGEAVQIFDGHPAQVYDAVFSPDGLRVATASVDETAKIWDVASGKEEATLIGHTNRIERIEFSPDGSQLATASWDQSAKLWDSHSGALLVTFTGHDDMVLDVTFDPSGERLVTSSADGTVRFMLMQRDQLMALARSRLHRSWTAEECANYLPGRRCPKEP